MGCSLCKASDADRFQTKQNTAESKANRQKAQDNNKFNKSKRNIQEVSNSSSDTEWDKQSAYVQRLPDQKRSQQSKAGIPVIIVEIEEPLQSDHFTADLKSGSDDDFRETGQLRVLKQGGLMFINQYLIVKYLGKGACGKVFLALNVQDRQMYALKIVQKEIIKQNSNQKKRNILQDMKREISIMKEMRHRNIVCLKEVIDDPKGYKIILVMEYMAGGCILARQELEKGEKIPEDIARKSFRDMVQALDYLHSHKIIHGDVKPENVLLSIDGQVKLSDFGCSKVLYTGNEYLEKCTGTPAFLAPEMMRPGHKYRGRPTDVYALGACLYTFVFGKLPFSASNLYQLFKMVQSEELKFPQNCQVSEQLQDLLTKIIVKNPKDRITLGEIMNHQWVTDNGQFPPIQSYQQQRHNFNGHLNQQNSNIPSTTNLGSQKDLNNSATTSMGTLPFTNNNLQFQLYNNGTSSVCNTTQSLSACTLWDTTNEYEKAQRMQILDNLAKSADNVKHFKKGETLWKQKDIGAFMVYIISGYCEIQVNIKSKTPTNNENQKPKTDQSSPQKHHQGQHKRDSTDMTNSQRIQKKPEKQQSQGYLITQEDLIFHKVLADASKNAKQNVEHIDMGQNTFQVSIRGEGEFIGEMAFFSNVNLRNATVVALSDLQVSIISKEQFIKFVQQYPLTKYFIKQVMWARECKLIEVEADSRLSKVVDEFQDRYKKLKSQVGQITQDQNFQI